MFDLHVHTGPDVVPRLGDDRQVVEWYAAAGFSGCVLKAHYDSTAGRAATAGAGLALKVYGGQALNQHVGGINPSAVAAALDMGARVIWMPTADSHTQQASGLHRLCRDHPELGQASYAVPPVDWSAAPRIAQILSFVAEADAVLATGHLSLAEIAWLVPEARRTGVRRILLTHPSFTVPDMSAAEARELTAQGCYAEVTANQLLSQPDRDAANLAGFVSAVGLRNVVLSSDAGQEVNPAPPQALELLVEALAAEGLDRPTLVACASEIPEALVSPSSTGGANR
ncbi:MAG: DUF6282 family protein [Acidimicrobiales bacterium]